MPAMRFGECLIPSHPRAALADFIRGSRAIRGSDNRTVRQAVRLSVSVSPVRTKHDFSTCDGTCSYNDFEWEQIRQMRRFRVLQSHREGMTR